MPCDRNNKCGPFGKCENLKFNGQDDQNSYKCHCNAGYEGVHCEDRKLFYYTCTRPLPELERMFLLSHSWWNIESIFIGIDHCQPNPCFNGSKCLSKQNHYECECRPGFDGPQCRHGKSHPIISRISSSDDFLKILTNMVTRGV